MVSVFTSVKSKKYEDLYHLSAEYNISLVLPFNSNERALTRALFITEHNVAGLIARIPHPMLSFKSSKSNPT